MSIDDAVAVLATRAALQQRVKQANIGSMLSKVINPVTPEQRAIQTTLLGAGLGGGAGLLRSAVDKDKRKHWLANLLQGATIGGGIGGALGVTRPWDPKRGMLGQLFAQLPEAGEAANRKELLNKLKENNEAGRPVDPAIVKELQKPVSPEASSSKPVSPLVDAAQVAKIQAENGAPVDSLKTIFGRRPFAGGIGALIGYGLGTGHNEYRLWNPTAQTVKDEAGGFNNRTPGGPEGDNRIPLPRMRQVGAARVLRGPMAGDAHLRIVDRETGRPFLEPHEYEMLHRHARTAVKGRKSVAGRFGNKKGLAGAALGYVIPQLFPFIQPDPTVRDRIAGPDASHLMPAE